MIILPDRNLARSKYLPPMHRRIWQRRWQGDAHIHFQTWVAQLYRPDHSMVWQGHFEDREDADEFMAALASGIIKQDGYLRRLPIYCPDFDPELLRDPSISYNMVTNIGIGPSSGTWTGPGDFWGVRGRAGEFVDCIGPGGGGAGTPALYTAVGGGGGGFARRSSGFPDMWPGYGVGFGVGNGGAGGTTYPAFPADQNPAAGAGGDAHTWWYSPANPGVQGNAGGGGTFGNNGDRPGGGGGGGANAGNFGYTGGRGGNIVSNGSTTGGGGAAGPNGNGNAGGDGGGMTGGGTANAGVTGAIYGPWGPGDGGTAGRGNPIGTGASGAHYGGGGGAGSNSASTFWPGQGGAGGAGLIVIRYEPTYQHTVSSISPTSGPTGGGQAVTITGTNFVGVTQADIGGSVLTGMSHNSTQIFGTTAAGGAGTWNVNVYTNQGPGVATGASLYTFVTPPSVSSASPSSGPTNASVLVAISGANLSGVSSVTFGGTASGSIAVINANLVHAWSPVPKAAGLVNVNVTNGYGSGNGNIFTYVTPPSVSSCAPTTGSTNGGTAVTITGANMAGVTSVTFGGTAATGVSVVNSTTITCTAPAHTAGLVSVAVTNGYGTGSANAFTFVVPPSISACSPVRGLTHGGTAVTLTGTDMSGVTGVTFGGTAATSLSVVNSTTITCVTPAHTRGLVNIVATNIYGSGTLTNGFDYLLPASGFNMPMGAG
jgi:hypothetical protein